MIRRVRDALTRWLVARGVLATPEQDRYWQAHPMTTVERRLADVRDMEVPS